ncbi:hypothetical protein KQ940_21675 [Marinobacterium sp. D7]|uniref:hypothetical protein n=1 Tax=Marinobacterium ramblicola TaxID=2849041 RepID=UPI001C2D3BEA|nr:hypothetical protein [Marinobacterium ramblicola]MBV1790679.1 hypothetical protein [Marinobacterium ramblicola]
MATQTTLLDRKQYHELDLIMWDHAERYVEPATAFKLYEQRWRFVDTKQMSAEETACLDALTAQYGHGHMLVA